MTQPDDRDVLRRAARAQLAAAGITITDDGVAAARQRRREALARLDPARWEALRRLGARA